MLIISDNKVICGGSTKKSQDTVSDFYPSLGMYIFSD